MALTSGLNSLNVDQATDEISNQAPVEQTLTSTEPTSAAEDATIRLQKQRAAYDQQLQKMMDSLQTRQNQFIDPKLAAMSAAFLDPGKTGSFGEAFGRAIKGYSDVSELENKEQRENAKMRLDLMKVSMSENEKNLIAQLTPKLFKTNEKGEYTGEMDPVIAQKIVAISGDPSIIQKIIEANKPNIKEVSPNATLFDVTHNKVLYQGAPKKTEFGQDLETLNDLKTQLSKDPNNKQLQDEVNKWSNYIKKKSEWEPKPQPTTEEMLPTAQMIADYKVAPPTISGRAMTGAQLALMNLVHQINPDYDVMVFKARQGDVLAQNAVKKDFAGTTQTSTGGQIQKFNAATNHLDLLAETIDAVNNKDFRTYNALKNEIKSEFGSADMTDFNAVKGIVTAEVLKAIVANGGSMQERIEMKNDLANKNSYDQLIGVVNRYRQLMAGQLDAIHTKYVKNFGIDDPSKDNFGSYLSPRAQKITGYMPLGSKSKEGAPTASIPKGLPEGSKAIGKTPEGKTVYQAPNGKKYVE